MQGAQDQTAVRAAWRPAAAVRFAAALVLLNGALTFHNLWPTFWPRPARELSLEVTLLVLVLAVAAEWRPLSGRCLSAGLAGLLALLALGRYVDVTAGGLFGRALDLYWDLPHLPDVAAMATASEPAWRIALMCLALAVAIALLLALLAWAVGAVTLGLSHRPTRRLTALTAAGLLAAYSAGMASDRLRSEWWFAFPVLPVYAKQSVKLAHELTRERSGPEAFAARPSDLRGLARSDVFLVFFESYGATLLETPRHAEVFKPSLAALSTGLAAAGWSSASGLFTSPTFGGASWLAHASVLSGARIDDQGVYQDFLKSGAASMITRFQQAGYRAVALMPGIRQAWPEGAGLGFDRIYSAALLDYRGAAFGWWRIPDQFSLERLLELEAAGPRATPLFVFFPTIMSHMPFQPTPPYLADWSRSTDPSAFAAAPVPPTGTQLDPVQAEQAYLKAVNYDLALLGGFLRQRAPRDALVLVVGDHQPPALVSGTEASWRVPVHILSRDPARLTPFLATGFRSGMLPGTEALGGLETLNGLLLGAFDGAVGRSAGGWTGRSSGDAVRLALCGDDRAACP